MQRVASGVVAAFATVAILTSCSSTAAPAAEPTSPAATSVDPANAQYDTTVDITRKPRISEEVRQRYGTKEVKASTAVALDVFEEHAYVDDLVVAKKGDSLGRLKAVSEDMTPSAAMSWEKAVAGFGKDTDSTTQVFAYTFYAPYNGSDYHGKPLTPAASGPAVVDKKVKNIRVSLLSDGRIQVQAVNSAVMRVQHGPTAKLWPIERTSALYMKKTNDGWKVDGWSSTWDLGRLRVEE
jgi:hypothetical protein